MNDNADHHRLLGLLAENSLWHLISDTLAPQQADDLAEDLGVEYDNAEHGAIERGPALHCCTSEKTVIF